MRRRPQHADRLSLPPPSARRRRAPGQRAAADRGQRGGHGAAGAGGNAGVRRGRDDAAGRPDAAGRAAGAVAGRRRRARQSALRLLGQPGAAPRRSGLAGRGAAGSAAAEADRRCRPGGPAQCRQIDPAGRHLARPAPDRRLSLHHPGPAAGRGRRRRRRLRHGRSAGPDRGRPPGRRPGLPFPGPCRTLRRPAASGRRHGRRPGR